MNQGPRGRWTRELLVAFAAGASLLAASLANFLTHNNYPYFRAEVALVVAPLLAIAALMAPFYVAQRQWGRSFLDGLLAVIFVDLNTDSLALAAAVGLLVAAIGAWRKMSLAGPMAMIGSIILATTPLGLGGSRPWIWTAKGAEPRKASGPASTKPAILHLILDEHIGVEGLSRDDADSRRMHDELRSFYSAAGFALYGGAYSEYMDTVNAIPHILNYGIRLGQGSSKQGVVVGPSEHLTGLLADGYKLTIIQSDFADLCTGIRVRECASYKSESFRPTLAAPLETADRASLMALKMLALSDLAIWCGRAWNAATAGLRGYGWALARFDPTNDGRSSTVAAIAAWDHLTDRLKTARPGDAYIAHILMPHYPYVVRSDCSYLPWKSWQRRRFTAGPGVRERAYAEQIRCTNRKLASALNALARSPAGKDAIVIVHGDHGSRITRYDPHEANLGKFDDRDFIAGFSTLFAIRAPGVRPAYFPERQPVAGLLRDFARTGFRSAPAIDPGRVKGVHLVDQAWNPTRRIPLPASWRTDAAAKH